MRREVLILAAIMALLTFAGSPDCMAQRNASKGFEKELYGKSRGKQENAGAGKQSPAQGKAAKAMKEQEKKEDRRLWEKQKLI